MLEENYHQISALQHFSYCQRQAILLYSELLWQENEKTVEGNILHERIDNGYVECLNKVRKFSNLLVQSKKYFIYGYLDLLEIFEESGVLTYVPIEYKAGQEKLNNCDKSQVIAYALCLEEMLNIKITKGSLYYKKINKRIIFDITDELISETVELISSYIKLFERKTIPKSLYDKRCDMCVVFEKCNPKQTKEISANYYKELFG
jgi:CRISPR-associated exonuclease Cas4